MTSVVYEDHPTQLPSYNLDLTSLNFWFTCRGDPEEPTARFSVSASSDADIEMPVILEVAANVILHHASQITFLKWAVFKARIRLIRLCQPPSA